MRQLVPDIQRLEELRDSGMTYQQIADWIKEHEGVEVSRMTINSAFWRAGKTSPRPRYEKHLPWKVQSPHAQHYAAKMLRLLGRRDQGLRLTKDQSQRLDSWLEKLKEEHAVVTYVPDSTEGFYYVDGEPNSDDIPIIKHI